MADQDHYKTYVRETRTTDTGGGSMAVIVGGLVVAVGFVLWFLFGALGPSDPTPVQGDTTNVTIEPPAAAPDATTPVDPDAAPAEPAPIEPAPADPAAVAPSDAAPAEPAPAPAPADE